MKLLDNKRVLLLAPPFYGYEKEITTKLKEFGADVLYLADDPKGWFETTMGVVSRLGCNNKWLVKIFEDCLYRRIGRQKFDIVLLINGPKITSRITKKIHNNNLQLGGRMILYYWDSLANQKDDHRRWIDFDSIYTFDGGDYQKYKSAMGFVPLFYCDKYWQTVNNKTKYDIMVVGSFRLNRYDYIKSLEKSNPSLNIGTYLFSPKWMIWFHKTFRNKYNHVKYSDLRYKKLSFQEVIDLYMQSKAVLDISALMQNGLTIRTFESLAMHKKIITSNTNIKSYDFFDADSIYIMDNSDSSLPSKEWFDSPFTIPDSVIVKYSITEWLRKILGYE